MTNIQEEIENKMREEHYWARREANVRKYEVIYEGRKAVLVTTRTGEDSFCIEAYELDKCIFAYYGVSEKRIKKIIKKIKKNKEISKVKVDYSYPVKFLKRMRGYYDQLTHEGKNCFKVIMICSPLVLSGVAAILATIIPKSFMVEYITITIILIIIWMLFWMSKFRYE